MEGSFSAIQAGLALIQKGSSWPQEWRKGEINGIVFATPVCPLLSCSQSVDGKIKDQY